MCNNRYRVVFVLQNLCGGGAERTTLNLMRHLNRDVFEPVLFLMEKEGIYFKDIPEDVLVEYGFGKLHYNKYLTPLYVCKLFWLVRGSSVLIGALQGRPTYISYIAAKLSRVPVIGWVRNPMDYWLRPWKKWHKWLCAYIYPRLTHIVCVSNAVKNSLEKMYKLNHLNITTIYNVKELEKIRRRSKNPLDSSLSRIFDEPTLISIGRLAYQKGYDILLEAHAKVLSKGLKHNLVIMGSGELQKELEEQIRSLKVTETVFMVGYIRNLYPWIKSATAVVMPSRFEGLPGVAIEALALGTPLIATKRGGLTELLDNGRYGLLVPGENAPALADAMIKMLSEAKLRKKFSESGPLRAERFAPERIIPQWDSLIKTLSRANTPHL